MSLYHIILMHKNAIMICLVFPDFDKESKANKQDAKPAAAVEENRLLQLASDDKGSDNGDKQMLKMILITRRLLQPKVMLLLKQLQ